jgi:apolipoprotein N-acyltransferase
MGFPQLFGPTIFLAPAMAVALLFRFILIHPLTLKKALALGLIFSFGYYAYGYYWIPHTLAVFGDISAPWNFIMGSFLSLILLPQLLITAVLIHYKKNIPLIAVAFLYALLEYLLPQQFPAHIGHAWLNLAPYIGLAPYVGAPVFTFISLWFFVSLFVEKKFRLIPSMSFALFFLLNFLVPLNPLKAPENMMVRMMQPNIGNFLKLGAEQGHFSSQRDMFRFYRDLTLLPVKDNKKLDLIIWPETAYPTMLTSELMRSDQTLLPPIVLAMVEQTQTPLYFGGYDSRPENQSNSDYQSEYNAGFLVNPETTGAQFSGVYRKMRLIPFGEGLPFGPLNPWLATYIKNISFFAQGEEFTSFELKNGKRFISAICYEVLFADFIREMLQAQKNPPHFLVNITNDSWYGKTTEPYQHFFLAKWRAVEFNLPLVRATNTGLTRVVLPDGSELGNGGLFVAENSDIEFKVEKDPTPTLYQRFGIFVLVLIFVLLYFAEKLFVKQVKNRE